jgi:hypothetical protein
METIARKQYIWFIITSTCLVLAFCGAALGVWYVYKTTRDAFVAKQMLATYSQNKETFANEVELARTLADRIAILEAKTALQGAESVPERIAQLLVQKGFRVEQSVVSEKVFSVSFVGTAREQVLQGVSMIETAVNGYIQEVTLSFVEGEWSAKVVVILQ